MTEEEHKEILVNLDARVQEVIAKQAERKKLWEAEAKEQIGKIRRQLETPDAPAVEPGPLVDAFTAQLVLSSPIDPEKEKARAWDTVIREELIRNRIPDRHRYQMTAWDCPQQEEAFQITRQIAIGTGAIIALIGERGGGKTTIAAQVVIERCWQDYRAMFVARQPGVVSRWMPYRKLSQIVARLKPLYADFGSIDSESMIAARDSFTRAHLLVIDEIHDCEDQRMASKVLVDLLDLRYSAMRDTIVISNQTEDQFQKTTSDSILSRISECGIILPCNWGSFRTRDGTLPEPKTPHHE